MRRARSNMLAVAVAVCVSACACALAAPPSPSAAGGRELKLTPIKVDSKTSALAYILAKANVAKELAKLFPSITSSEESSEQNHSGDEWNTSHIHAKHIKLPNRQKYKEYKQHQENSDTKYKEENKPEEKNNKPQDNNKSQENNDKYQEPRKYEELSTLSKHNLPEEVISLLSHLNDDKTKDSKHNHIVVLKHKNNGKEEDSQVHNIIKENLNALQDDLLELNALVTGLPVKPLVNSDVTNAGATPVESIVPLSVVNKVVTFEDELPIQAHAKEIDPDKNKLGTFKWDMEVEFDDEADSYLVDSIPHSVEILPVSELVTYKDQFTNEVDNSYLVDSSSESESLVYDTNEDFQFNVNYLDFDEIPEAVRNTPEHIYSKADIKESTPKNPNLTAKPEEIDDLGIFKNQLVTPFYQDSRDIVVTSQKDPPKAIRALTNYDPLQIPVAIVQEPVDHDPDDHDSKVHVSLDPNVESIPVAIVQEPVDFNNHDHNVDSDLKLELPLAHDHKVDPLDTNKESNLPFAYEYQIDQNNDFNSKHLDSQDLLLVTQHDPLDANDADAALPSVRAQSKDLILPIHTPIVKELSDIPVLEGMNYVIKHTADDHKTQHHHHLETPSHHTSSVEEHHGDFINYHKNDIKTHTHQEPHNNKITNQVHTSVVLKDGDDTNDKNTSGSDTQALTVKVDDFIDHDTPDEHKEPHSHHHHHHDKASSHHELKDDEVKDHDTLKHRPDIHKPHSSHHKGHHHYKESNHHHTPDSIYHHSKDTPTLALDDVTNAIDSDDPILAKLEELLLSHVRDLNSDLSVSTEINDPLKKSESTESNPTRREDAVSTLVTSSHYVPSSSSETGIPLLTHNGVPISLLNILPISLSHDGGVSVSSHYEGEANIPVTSHDTDVPVASHDVGVPVSSPKKIETNIPISLHDAIDPSNQVVPGVLRNRLLPTAIGGGYNNIGVPIATGDNRASGRVEASDDSVEGESCDENVQQNKYYQLSFIFNK